MCLGISRSKRFVWIKLSRHELVIAIVQESKTHNHLCLQSNTNMSNTECSAHHWIHRNGFKRGIKSGKLSLDPSIIAQIYNYIGELINSLAESMYRRRRQLYLDRQCIYQNYCRNDESIYDPNDNKYKQSRKPLRYRRIYFFLFYKLMKSTLNFIGRGLT